MFDGLYDSTPVEYIPAIDLETIYLMREQITPALLDPDRNCMYRIKGIDEIDARGYSFIWDAKREGEPLVWSPLDHLKIPSLHSWGAPSLFKPTIAECFAAIRRYLPDYSRVRWMAVEQFVDDRRSIVGTCHLAYLHLFGDSVGTVEECNARERRRVAKCS